MPEGGAEFPEEAEGLLAACTFDFPPFAKKMRDLGVARLERDLLPYAGAAVKRPPGLGTSVYFPFGYVSTGRVCRVASFNKAPAARAFRPLDACPAPCNGLLLEMANGTSSFRLFEGGNTVFYLYPPSVLGRIARNEDKQKARLVCQGLAI